MDRPTAISWLAQHLERRLTFVDVGARWGAASAWNAFGDRAQVLCFEPDTEECARLAAAAPANVTYLPFALAETAGEIALTVTREPACSSRYPPRPSLYRRFPALDIIRPERTLGVPARPLDDVVRERGIASVDLLKLDTQGSELDVLRGAEDCLPGCTAVDVEVEFNPLYEGQNLFCDLDRFLRDRGFVLWRLTDLVHYGVADLGLAPAITAHATPGRSVQADPGDGQLFWAQAHYVREALTPAGDASRSPSEPVVAAAVVAALGHWDLSLHILDMGGKLAIASGLREAIGAEHALAPPRTSRSWRLTAPLRWLSGCLRRT